MKTNFSYTPPKKINKKSMWSVFMNTKRFWFDTEEQADAFMNNNGGRFTRLFVKLSPKNE